MQPELFPKHNSDISIRFQNRQLALKVTQHEYVVLRQRGYVKPVAYKGDFGWGELLVPYRVAARLLSPLQVESSAHISKRRQDKGAKHWIARLDRADMGATARCRQMVFTPIPSHA